MMVYGRNNSGKMPQKLFSSQTDGYSVVSATGGCCYSICVVGCGRERLIFCSVTLKMKPKNNSKYKMQSERQQNSNLILLMFISLLFGP